MGQWSRYLQNKHKNNTKQKKCVHVTSGTTCHEESPDRVLLSSQWFISKHFVSTLWSFPWPCWHKLFDVWSIYCTQWCGSHLDAMTGLKGGICQLTLNNSSTNLWTLAFKTSKIKLSKSSFEANFVCCNSHVTSNSMWYMYVVQPYNVTPFCYYKLK